MKGSYMILQKIGKGWDIGKVRRCSGVGLSMNILGELTEEHVDRPHFRCAKRHKMGYIWPKHERCHNFLSLAVWVICWHTLDFVVFVNQSIWVVHFWVNPLILGLRSIDRIFAIQFEWCIMEFRGQWAFICFLYHSYYFAIAKARYGELSWRCVLAAWRHFNIDVGFLEWLKVGWLFSRSVGLPVLLLSVEFLEIFQMEIGIKRYLVDKAVHLGIRFLRAAGILPVHQKFSSLITISRGFDCITWKSWRCAVDVVWTVKVFRKEGGIRVIGRSVKIFLPHPKYVWSRGYQIPGSSQRLHCVVLSLNISICAQTI